MNTLFLADWCNVVFLHFRVPAQALQPHVPFELDLFDGDAFISLVAFTQKRLRPARGGRLAALLVAPLAEHEFLNVRTYVRHRGTHGIYFIVEYVPNRLAKLLGPNTYGLPYRLGQIDYRSLSGAVGGEGFQLRYAASFNPSQPLTATVKGLDEFLLERYTAFTRRRRSTLRFDIAHSPWQWRRVAVQEFLVSSEGIVGELLRASNIAASHHSPGIFDVAISWPRSVPSHDAERLLAQK